MIRAMGSRGRKGFTELPEDVILNILCRLPVKSLIRFTTVSKRWSFIILSDPKFAASQFEAARHRKTLGRRLLFFTDPAQLESLEMDATSFDVRKTRFPSLEQQPDRDVTLVGSCNGLVFVSFDGFSFHIWNPATRFLMELPNPGFSDGAVLMCYGAAYSSATKDYKVFAGINKDDDDDEFKMFSLRAHAWKTIQQPDYGSRSMMNHGTLFNEALHWVSVDEIFALDLAKEEFRTMPLPDQHHVISAFQCVGVSEGCLCAWSFLWDGDWKASPSIHFWVMREYGVYESWDKLFNIPHLANNYLCRDLFVMENCIIVVKEATAGNPILLVKIDREQGNEVGKYMIGPIRLNQDVDMIPYEESLLWIND